MLWIKSFHLIFMVAWFAGAFYLPRLFVYHTQAANAADSPDSPDSDAIARFIVMERKLFWVIMTPAAILTLGFGIGLWGMQGFAMPAWMAGKLILVGGLVIFHAWCWRQLIHFRRRQNRHGETYFRWMNEVPTLLLIGIVILATVKPL